MSGVMLERFGAPPSGPPPPPELFPDPTLDQTGDTNQWQLDGVMMSSNFGSDIQVFNADDTSFASIIGTLLTAFDAAVANNSTKTVQITIGLVAEPGIIYVTMKDGTPVAFSFIDAGTISHNVTAGTDSGFYLSGQSAGTPSFTITGISVT